MTHHTVIVLSLAGFSPSLLTSGNCPAIAAYAETCGWSAMTPALPALTLPMQATLTTGAVPGEHGIVANGFFDRNYLEHRFWSASSGLLDRHRVFEPSQGADHRGVRPDPKVAALFWWNFLGADLRAYLNVAPFHLADGSTRSSCASRPAGLYAELESKLGPFPLHRFWGPMVTIESSQWILDATLEVAERIQPHLLLSYLPHMDYAQQHSGPHSSETAQDLRDLDALLAPVIERAQAGDWKLVLLSEYGIMPVSRPVTPNRALRAEGLFQVRRLDRREHPDLAGSRAFAICDHQIAHVYVAQEADAASVRRILEGLPGVSRVLDRAAQTREGLGHHRSGDLVLLSAPDAWFAYPWWTEDEAAPDYAATIDIHRKIGYDPLELILDRHTKAIAQDASLIKGSHGLVPVGAEYKPLVISPYWGAKYSDPPGEIHAVEVADLLMNLLDHCREAQ